VSSYNFLLDGITWSYSNLKCFEDCPRAWYLKYIECRNTDSDNIYAQFGTFCHKLLEYYFKGIYQKDELINIYERDFYDYVEDAITLKNNPTEKLYGFGYKYFSNINLDRDLIKPIYIEQEVKFKIDRYSFRGFIDLMHKDEKGSLIILDHKTSEYPVGKKGAIKKSKEQMMKGYTRQLALYAYGVEQSVGKRPEYIGWNFIREGKEYIIKLSDSIILDALNWATDIIRSIYRKEDFEKKESYIMCSVLCDSKRACWEDS